MRVLVVIHGFPPDQQGGSEVYAHAHARALAGQGAEVLVFTRDNDPARPEYAVRRDRVDGLEVVRVNNTFRHARAFAETYANARIDAVAREAIEAFRPDVAHIHHLTCLSTGVTDVLASRGVPMILTLHDYWLLCHRGQFVDTDGRLCEMAGPGEVRLKPDPTYTRPDPTYLRPDPTYTTLDLRPPCVSCLGPAAGIGRSGFTAAAALRAVERRVPMAGALRRLAPAVTDHDRAGREARARADHMRQVLARMAHLIAPSRYVRDVFVAAGVSAERISVSRYGFDRGASRMWGPPSGGPAPTRALRIGFLGSLMLSKAPHVLLEAFAGLPPGAATLEVHGAHAAYHGDDSYRSRLAPLLDQQGVRVHGPIPHDRVPVALASLDVLVVPSIWPEVSPLVIDEAFLAGIPVVASRIGGIPERVAHEVNGLLCEPGSVPSLRSALRRLIDEPALLTALRRGMPSVRAIEDDAAWTRRLYGRCVEGPAVGLTFRSGETSTPGATPAPPDTTRLAAIVLNYATPDQTSLAVRSLARSSRPIDEIIVVDNSADAACRDALAATGVPVTYLPTARNLGYAGGMNAGIRAAVASGVDRVFLVNSDVIVPPDCVEALMAVLDAEPHAGIAGPVIVSRSAPDTVIARGVSYDLATGRLRLRDHGARHGPYVASGFSRTSRVETVDAVTGCAMLVDRRVFERVGLFHEEYFFGFEDLDLCLAARRAGLMTLLTHGAVAYHEGSRSIGAASPDRFYYAARNHQLAARRAARGARRRGRVGRAVWIAALNLAHAIRPGGGSVGTRLAAVVRGTRDYAVGRFGPVT